MEIYSRDKVKVVRGPFAESFLKGEFLEEFFTFCHRNVVVPGPGDI